MSVLVWLVVLAFAIIALAASFFVFGRESGEKGVLSNPNIVDLSDLPEGSRDGIKICIDIERNHYASKNEIKR